MSGGVIRVAPGVTHYPELLGRAERTMLTEAVLAIADAAPFYRPVMPRTAKPFSVEMTNCGRLGWVSDRDGYRYQTTHPATGMPWPEMPEIARTLWATVGNYAAPAECCLINWYRNPKSRMGLHQDRDEQDMTAPVVSISLGDKALFRIRAGGSFTPSKSFWLGSGDVVVLSGPARLIHHGIDRLQHGSSRLVPGGGRFNLTLRRVTRPV